MGKNHKDVRWFEKLSDEHSSTLKGKLGNRYVQSRAGKNLFEQNVWDAYSWIDAVARELELQERKDVAWNLLREVLHLIRDRITIEEVFHLSAQLPTLIRGMYFEGYSVRSKPQKFHMKEVEKRLTLVLRGVPKIDHLEAFGAVLAVLHDRVSAGELEDIRGILPKDIKAFWDKSKTKIQLEQGEHHE